MRNQQLGGRYRILDRIGEGGMAYVYVALDEKLGRKVAIKILHEHMERNPDIRKRFQLEAQAVSVLDHPNIVKIYDFSGAQSERLWIVTEIIRGKNLAQYIERYTKGLLHPVIASCVVREIIKALEKAHSQGIVHRDIKPENVMLTTEGRIKLMDFGIAKDLGKSNMTITGTFMGSPSYMSPEQIRGRDIDLRSDLYSLSVLYYEIVTGRLPFTGQTTHDVVMRIMEGEFTYPRFIAPHLPEKVDEMIVMGMSKDPRRRFQLATEYGANVDRFIASIGFDESHIELERYFKDRQQYEARLAQNPLSTQQNYGRRPSVIAPPVQQTRQQTFNSPTQILKTTERKVPPPPQPYKSRSIYEKAPTHHPTRSIPLPSEEGYPEWRTAHIARAMDPAPMAPLPPPPPRIDMRVSQAIAPAAARVIIESAKQRQQGRRIVKARPRRHIVTTQVSPPWFSYFFGTLLVGLLITISLWGFFGLGLHLKTQPRTAQTPPRSPERTEQVDQTTKSRPKITTSRKTIVKNETKKKSGTPVVIKQITRRPQNEVATPQPQDKRPKVVTIVKKPAKDREDVKASAAVATPAVVKESATEPNLLISSQEIERKKAPPETPAPEAAPGRGRVLVSSQPAAEIIINGRRMGTTIDNTNDSGWIALSSGKYSLELRRRGYASFRSQFTLNDGEDRAVPRVTLEPTTNTEVQSSSLTLRTSHFPAQVTILNLDTKTPQSFTMKNPSKTVELEQGRYHVTVEHNGQIKDRELNLTGQKQLTFSADFKDEVDSQN